MSTTTSKVDEILDVAEALVQTRGYNGFSFRDVAAAVGVKSSSVHYHFPTKADLGATLARRYRERFLDKLGYRCDLVVNGLEAVTAVATRTTMGLPSMSASSLLASPMRRD